MILEVSEGQGCGFKEDVDVVWTRLSLISCSCIYESAQDLAQSLSERHDVILGQLDSPIERADSI